MNRWNQIAQRVVPGAPFVAVERLVVLRVDLTAKFLPMGKPKTAFKIFRVECEGHEPWAGKVLALVEF